MRTFDEMTERIRSATDHRLRAWSAEVSLPKLRIPRVIRRRLRRPPVFWLLTLVVAITIGLFTARAVQAAEDGASIYGDPTEVVVATRDLAPGALLDADSARLERRPRDVVATGALTSLPDGRPLTTEIYAGQVVVAAQVAEPDVSPLAAIVPDGHRAMAIGRSQFGLEVKIGDRVDALSFDPVTGEMGLVTTAARVLATDDTTVTLSVALADVALTAAAVSAGDVVLALVHP